VPVLYHSITGAAGPDSMAKIASRSRGRADGRPVWGTCLKLLQVSVNSRLADAATIGVLCIAGQRAVAGAAHVGVSGIAAAAIFRTLQGLWEAAVHVILGSMPNCSKSYKPGWLP
jgi:hypothetical protein